MEFSGRPPRPDEATDPRDATEDATRERALRALLGTFLGLTLAIAVIGFAAGSLREALLSLAGGTVYALLLFLMPRWGARRVGVLTTIWYFVLAIGAMAQGRGIHDVTTVLLPAGMLMGAVLLPRGRLVPLVAISVAAAAGIGVAHLSGLLHGEPGSVSSLADVVVLSLLLLVAGALARIVVRSLQGMLAERRKVEQALRETARELKARNEGLQLVSELAHRLQHRLEVEAIASETVDVLIRLSTPPLAAFYLLEEEGTRLRLVDERGFTKEERALGAVLPMKGSLSGLALAEQRLVSTDDLGRDERVRQPIGQTLASRGVRTALSIPLSFSGEPFGVVNLIFREGKTFEPLELDTFQAVGQAVSLAIANSRHVAGLEHQAFHDTLTRLPNRASLHQRFAQLRGSSSDEPAGLVLLDLNRFREINDALGHHVGDELLVEIAARLDAACGGRRSEPFRLGGDEFVVLLTEIDGLADAETEAQVLLGAFSHTFEVAGMGLQLGASAGIAVFPEHGRDSHELLRCADVAMYRAKRAVGGIASYVRDLDHHTPERLVLVSELTKAVREGGLLLHFQPKVALDSGKVTGFEALVRWQHPRLGLLAPGAFLPSAEASDVMHPLTYWVVENGLEQLKRWSARAPDLTLAINLSVRNLLDRKCSRRLEEIIKGAGVDPGRVEFELTETAVMTDPEAAATMLGRITETGARLAIDDFGTGYSSLAWLSRLPVHEIKIDQSFVRDMATRAPSRAIVRSTVHLAHGLGLSVVAEGIEDGETVDALRDMACDQGQGYFFARPAPAEVAGRLIGESLVAGGATH